MKIKSALFFMVLFMIALISVKVYDVQGEEKPGLSRVSLSPAYVDLGVIKDTSKTVKIVVMNRGKAVKLKAKIDNGDGVPISIAPDILTLQKNEKKEITIKLSQLNKIKIGIYDLSISFIAQVENKDSVTAYGTNSLRLIFRKEGLVKATCNVKDIAPIQEVAFHSILCNFFVKSKKVDVSIDIKRKDTGEVIWQQKNQVTMNPYPTQEYYGRVDTPIPSTPWKYGDYIYHLKATQKNDTLLEYQKEFNVGEQKGKLLQVYAKDVNKGERVQFHAKVQNVGTQRLPVSVTLRVTDSKKNLIYEGVQSDELLIKTTKDFRFTWATKYAQLGKYTIDYTVHMGKQQENGTIYYKVHQPIWVWWTVVSGILLLAVILSILIFRSCICSRRRNCETPLHTKQNILIRVFRKVIQFGRERKK